MKNADLIVKGRSAGSLRINYFDKAEEMTNWEFAAYDAYTQQRCEAERIGFLADLFGKDFSDAFYARKDSLIIDAEMRDLLRRRDALNVRIKALMPDAMKANDPKSDEPAESWAKE